MINEIIVPIEAQRLPLAALIALTVLFLGLACFFAINLLVPELRQLKPDLLKVTLVGIVVITFVGINLGLYLLYRRPQEIRVALTEDRLEISSAKAPIPLEQVEAEIADMQTATNRVNYGSGLIFKFRDRDRYFELSAIDGFLVIYMLTDRLQLAIGRAVSAEKAAAFLRDFNAQKAKLLRK